jgi:hypothetical protein
MYVVVLANGDRDVVGRHIFGSKGHRIHLHGGRGRRRNTAIKQFVVHGEYIPAPPHDRSFTLDNALTGLAAQMSPL